MTETSVTKFFERYERFFTRSLGGDIDVAEVASLYASDFIAASPAGVMTGKNDDRLKEVMAQGYAHYRAIGTKEMRIRSVATSPIDEHHCVAHVAWRAIYTRQNQADITIDFDVHYLVQKLNGEPKIFGWVSGDEQALLKKHGVM
ncbi:MAG TPA: nuclear transport factor 2 family protein [Gammaproteobacteria bacterium]|nr:nuclear transport factor 2 family protein [Gammaproteobacteria bacterium]